MPKMKIDEENMSIWVMTALFFSALGIIIMTLVIGTVSAIVTGSTAAILLIFAELFFSVYYHKVEEVEEECPHHC